MHEAVSNSGPLIHLNEIDYLELFNLFKKIIIADKVFDEVGKDILNKLDNKEVVNIDSNKLKSLLPLIKYFKLQDAEIRCLYLARKQEALFLTDDLEARGAAKKLNINVHGTIGIVILAYKKDILTKNESKNIIWSLYNDSSLFLTEFLVNLALKEIDKI